MLKKAIVDISDKEFTAGLTFVAASRVRALKDLLFKLFNFERLQHIKNCKRLQERLDKEKSLISMISRN